MFGINNVPEPLVSCTMRLTKLILHFYSQSKIQSTSAGLASMRFYRWLSFILKPFTNALGGSQIRETLWNKSVILKTNIVCKVKILQQNTEP